MKVLVAHNVAARLVVLVLLLATAGCASAGRLDAAASGPAAAPALAFGRDTFAFPNESLTKNRDKPDLYANYW